MSTPIGNMEDLSPRAASTLKNADLVAAEDTRHSRHVMDKVGGTARVTSYHEHNEREKASSLLQDLREGKKVAVVSDAGTPGIADPAYRIVHAAVAENITVIPIPGPCALIAALTASGLPTDRFAFEGFLPPKSGKRQRKFSSLLNDDRTIIFYESPHRILRSLEDLQTVYGDIHIVIARELTKMHETFYRAPVSQVIQTLTKETPRGEFVLLFNLKAAGVYKEKEEPEDNDDAE
ncbi:MAG: 16S rRNA (cytidine(1402)-2'-O)-methyltransferase [Fibrobacteres bacterium]|nr:16S rRNA (cytidine(1402)-2'-O)-methyltransferase [Fibrobacterota bacterium]